MDKYSLWNPQHNLQLETGSQSSMGFMYEQMRYPPPPLQQSYQTLPEHYVSYPSISYPPPPGPPLTSFSPSVPPPQLDASQMFVAHNRVGSETAQLETDKQWLINWLSQCHVQPAPKTTPIPNGVKLKDIQVLLLKCSSAVKELQELHRQLSTLSSYADGTTWNSLLSKVNSKKAALAVLVSGVRSLDLAAIKSKLSKRVKKRGRLRRKRAKAKEMEEAEHSRRKMLHQRADACLAQMRLTVEREHREEELRREADAVLAEVTRKQTEAKRQLCLLDALVTLRQVRAQRAAMHSSNQHEANHSARKFATVIERVREMWRSQLKEYDGEERGLRVMLHESAAQESDARCQRIKATLEQWEQAIFGQTTSPLPPIKDINRLVAVRAEWDRYVVPHCGAANTPMASSIPVGWLLPQEPSSDLWRLYCAAYDEDD